MTLKLIRLELARTKEFPEGDPRHGYELRAPLTMDGRLDPTAFEHPVKGLGPVLRPRRGRRRADLPVGRPRFSEREYVTITEHGGEARVFRVVSMADVPLPQR
jgi:hypothetical protein